MALIKKITGGFSASAKVVDGTLILSLPDAISPVVWRMELGHAKSSAIEVRAQDDGTHMLTLKTPKGDINDIAPYASRAKAVEALVAISNALEHAHGHIQPANNSAAGAAAPARARSGSRGGSLLTGIVGLALVVMLIAVLMKMNPLPPGATNPAGGDMSASGSMPGQDPAGQAMSADDFLRNR